MKKTFVLDTSVLVFDPNCFSQFPGHEVIIPINVLIELDKLKTFPNETGKNARICIRYLNELCQLGQINKGVKTENNTLIRVDSSETTDKFGTGEYADDKILACAYSLKEKNIKKKTPVILVSRDIALRIRAQAYNLEAEDYEKNKVDFQDLYIGYQSIVNQELGELLSKRGSIEINSNKDLQKLNLNSNECLYVESEGRGLALAKRVGDKVQLCKSLKPWGLELRNKEQVFATDLIFDSKIPLVTLIGSAGTGKTLISMGSALELVLEKKIYNKLIVYRPIHTVGSKDLGYLPGTLEEKLYPYMAAIYDSLEFLLSNNKGGDKWKTMLEMYIGKGLIQLEAISYIRGRSIPNALIVCDEAQNLSLSEIKVLLTRLGEGSKLILTGDISQIDNNSLSPIDNGLTYVTEAFKSSSLSGHITLMRGERSELATLASSLL